MSYRAGIGPGFGVPPSEPTITCDGGCGAKHVIEGILPAWFLRGKAVPGWSLKRTDNGRIDLCRECRTKRTPAPEPGDRKER